LIWFTVSFFFFVTFYKICAAMDHRTETKSLTQSLAPSPQTATAEIKNKNCPACKKPERCASILFCCETKICIKCLMLLVYQTKPAVCPFCKQDPHKAVMDYTAHERKTNPNEAHISSWSMSSKANGLIVPIRDGHMKASEIMEKISAAVGFDLSKEVEGGYMDYKLVYRGRYLDLNKTMYENNWGTGIAEIQLVESRTPASDGPHRE